MGISLWWRLQNSISFGGDDLDYNMNLLYFSKEGNDKYDLEEPNFFGLSIAYDHTKWKL